VVPVIMLVILIAIQMAVWADAAETVQAAAAFGSQSAAAFGGSIASGRAATESYLSLHGGLLEKGASVDLAGITGGFVSVRVDATTVSIVPFLHLGTSASREEPMQEFRESG